LRRIGTDYLDLYQAHRFDNTTPLEETLRAFDDLVRQGKVLYVGVSEWRAHEIEKAHKIADQMGFDRLVSNQPQYNMLWRVIESEVVPLGERAGLGQIVWSPIAGGLLPGKYKPGQEAPAGSRAVDPKSKHYIEGRVSDQELLERVQRLQPLADEVGLSLAQLSVALVLLNQNVSTAIIGDSRPAPAHDHVTDSGDVLGVDMLGTTAVILVAHSD